MDIKVNCTYNEKGAWCNNLQVTRSVFGLGARCCKVFNGKHCEFQCSRVESRPNPPKGVGK